MKTHDVFFDLTIIASLLVVSITLFGAPVPEVYALRMITNCMAAMFYALGWFAIWVGD